MTILRNISSILTVIYEILEMYHFLSHITSFIWSIYLQSLCKNLNNLSYFWNNFKTIQASLCSVFTVLLYECVKTIIFNQNRLIYHLTSWSYRLWISVIRNIYRYLHYCFHSLFCIDTRITRSSFWERSLTIIQTLYV